MEDPTSRAPIGDVGASLPGAQGSLADAVYAHLRALAQSQLNHERPGHTLSATALVHEAFLRLRTHPAALPSDGDQPGSLTYAEFMRAAAQAMRRILIEHGRSRASLKRGGGRASVRLDDIRDVAQLSDDDDPHAIVAFDDAISRLEAHNPRFAEVVRLRFFAGLGVAETAVVLGVSERTVNVDWMYARAWLARDLSRSDPP